MTDDSRLLEDADESGVELRTFWASFVQARVRDYQDQSCEITLGYVQRALGDIQWTFCKEQFGEMRAAKKKSAFGTDGLPYSVRQCAGEIGSQLLFAANTQLLDGIFPPTSFAASTTVPIPKSIAVNDQGRIVRSLDSLRPLTLCNCDWRILTTALCIGLRQYSMSCIHQVQRSVTNRQMSDNIF